MYLPYVSERGVGCCDVWGAERGLWRGIQLLADACSVSAPVVTMIQSAVAMEMGNETC